MLDKLKAVALRYEDLQAQLGNPVIYGNAERLRAVTRESKELEPVVAAYRAYEQARADFAGAEFSPTTTVMPGSFSSSSSV